MEDRSQGPGNVKFDKNGTKVCGSGSHNRTCFLPGRMTTTVEYKFRGTLVFTQGNKSVYVNYDAYHPSGEDDMPLPYITMSSSNKKIVNENRGNLTINNQ